MRIRRLQEQLKSLLHRNREEEWPSDEGDQRPAYLALLRGVELVQAAEPDPVAAVEAFQEALILYKQADNTRFKSLVQKIIGLLFEMIDDPDRARRTFRSAIRMLEIAALPDESAHMHLLLANFEARHGNRREAMNALREALSLYRRIGHAAGESEALVQFGELEIDRGKRAEAHAHARQAEAFLPLIADLDMRLRIEARVGRLLAA